MTNPVYKTHQEYKMAPYFVLAHAGIWPFAKVYTGLWILGVIGIFLGKRQVRRRVDKQLEKEVLIKEVHHRVKNNFAIVSSLLGLQSHDIQDKDVREMFMKSRDRINSMALLHERLYKSQELISNALKHAFPENHAAKGQVNVTFHQINGNEVELAVMDNGIGLPEDFDIGKNKSLGLQLVSMMTEGQLGGKLKVNGGAKFQIQFVLHA